MSDGPKRYDRDEGFNRDRDWRDRDVNEQRFNDRDRHRSDPALNHRPGYGSEFEERDRSFNRPQRDDQRGGAGYGYGDGGYTSYGQITRGGSDQASGGYGGSNAGGFGQQTMNSQWGGGGYGPMTQGSDYSQGGAQFGPSGYDSPRWGGGFAQAPHRDARDHNVAQGPAGEAHHDESYRRWRDTQLDSHDRDYHHWRTEQSRRYDEDYSGWRNDRHTAFSKEFETWRAGRGGTPTPQPGQTGSAHGANPALGDIADGGNGAGRHEARHVAQELKHQEDHAKHEAHSDASKEPKH